MKKLLLLGALGVGVTIALAAEQTVTGVVTDGMCQTNHAMMQSGAKKMSNHDCFLACVKAGQKYVLASGDKVYQIENQSFAALEKNAGNTVKATGQVSADGKSIHLRPKQVLAV